MSGATASVVPPDLAAEYAGVSLSTLRSWAHRPNTGIKRYPGGFCLSEIDRWKAARKAQMDRSRRALA